jgi:hypothetical protein
MSSEKPLPFQYQFAAGAIAGVSEVSDKLWDVQFGCKKNANRCCFSQILVMYLPSPHGPHAG